MTANRRIPFTKMHGAGNDFVVLDETRDRLNLGEAQYRFLADRHFGVGADQILTVRPSPAEGIDFEYVIHNADGGEVEQCGNGSRCFVKFVRDKGLTEKSTVRVRTMSGDITLMAQTDGRVTVNMGAPIFDAARIPFDDAGLTAQVKGHWQQWPVSVNGQSVLLSALSMGNPHAVLLVDDVNTAPVETLGPALESHERFPRRVNVGFLQIKSRGEVGLRVYERGAGETLACGTGACAAVVAGIRLGLLDESVNVQTRGGVLSIAWAGLSQGLDAPVMMTGPAVTVFESEIEIP
jgi:diaminopimelate epimerase